MLEYESRIRSPHPGPRRMTSPVASSAPRVYPSIPGNHNRVSNPQVSHRGLGPAVSSFVHLHTHTEYSLLDGAARIDALFERAKAFEMPALALTDHGAMFGALRFYEAGLAAGVKPILGVETYVAPSSRFERAPGESEEKYRHLTILARDETGYRNLLHLVTDAHLEGFYHRPRIDKELLAERSEGLIGLSGCLASEVAQLAARRPGREGGGGGRDVRGHLRCRELLRRAPGPRARRPATGPAEADRARPPDGAAARGDERPALHGARATRSPTTCCCASSSRRCRPTRTGCGSTRTSST